MNDTTVPSVRCRCGYDRSNKILYPRTNYSILGWISQAVGISSRPTKVEIVCPVCGHVFETIIDPDERNRYRYR